MTRIEMTDDNLLKLRQIQNLIRTEEDIYSDIDEVLSRVLSFYGRFVPY